MREHSGNLLCEVDPQPNGHINYVIGGGEYGPYRLHCERWGNLGPMEFDSEIQPNEAGLRVVVEEIPAPKGARGVTVVDGVYWWTDTSVWDKTLEEK